MQVPEHSTSVREMPVEERPRERLARLGPEVLRDAELMAILFRTGTRSFGAVALAENVLAHFGNLRGLSQASIEEIQAIKGLGEAKSIEIKAALELGKRLASFKKVDRQRVSAAKQVVDLLMVRFKDYEAEHFKCVLLNSKNDILKIVDVSKGGLDSASAVPRDVYRQAVREGATAVIVCHNHPSGDPTPSRDDLFLTKRLSEAGTLLGVSFIDHIVFGDGSYVSLKEKGLL